MSYGIVDTTLCVVPKYRFRVLQGPVGTEAYKCVMVFSQQLGGEVVELNVQPDHVHQLERGRGPSQKGR